MCTLILVSYAVVEQLGNLALSGERVQKIVGQRWKDRRAKKRDQYRSKKKGDI